MLKSSCGTVILLQLLAGVKAQFIPRPPIAFTPLGGQGGHFGQGGQFGQDGPCGQGEPGGLQRVHSHIQPHLFPHSHKHQNPQPQLTNLTLCTTNQLEQDKCLYALKIAAKNSINLRLNCTLKANSSDDCLSAVEHNQADLVVSDENQYFKARLANLVPLLYAHESPTSYYIAVAPKNIRLLQVGEATLDVDSSNPRALHAAAFFNYLRGNNICSDQNEIRNVTIKIIDSAHYVPKYNEIVICPNFDVMEALNYDATKCNIEAGLEHAIFASRASEGNQSFTRLLQNIFDTLQNSFGQQSKIWNIFSDFDGVSDVIFKKNTIGFSLIPANRNGVTEQRFYSLLCNLNE